MADLVKQVDTGNSSGTDYTSLQTWSDAFGGVAGSGDCVTNTTRAIASWICTGGVADVSCTVSGWAATDASYYPMIRVPSAYQFTTRVPTAGNYSRVDASADIAITITVPYTRVDGGAFRRGASDVGNVIYVNAGNCVITNCASEAYGGSGVAVAGLFTCNAPSARAVFANCIGYVADGTSARGFRVINSKASADVIYYNCVAYASMPFAIGGTADTVKAINCAGLTSVGSGPSFNDVTTWNATASFNNAASNSAAIGGTATQFSQTAGDAIFRSVGAFDFHIAAGSSLANAGKNLYADAIYAVTIDAWGGPRPSTGAFDIGADEEGVVALSLNGSVSLSEPDVAGKTSHGMSLLGVLAIFEPDLSGTITTPTAPVSPGAYPGQTFFLPNKKKNRRLSIGQHRTTRYF